MSFTAIILRFCRCSVCGIDAFLLANLFLLPYARVLLKHVQLRDQRPFFVLPRANRVVFEPQLAFSVVPTSQAVR